MRFDEKMPVFRAVSLQVQCVAGEGYTVPAQMVSTGTGSGPLLARVWRALTSTNSGGCLGDQTQTARVKKS